MPTHRNASSFIAAGAILIAVIFCVGAAKNLKTAELRLQLIEDRDSVRQLLVEYGQCLDRRDFKAFSMLFAEKEGEWIGGMGKAKGSEAIRRLMEQTIRPDASKKAPNFHIFTNEIINIDGDRATAAVKWMFVASGEASQPRPLILGHYQDDIVRENGHWKFLKRVVYADIPSDDLLAAGGNK
jgi:hypothetical protein